MKALGIRLLLTTSIAAFVAFLDVGEADAHTCKSACNQIDRACGHAEKAARKAALAQCDLDRDSCRELCEVDPDCPDCNDARTLCREAADTVWQQAKDACRVAGEACPPETCVDPIDGDCVRDCSSDQKDCARLNKKNSRACKKGCPTGNGRRGCVRLCKKQLNEALVPCSDIEALCLGGCITPSP